MRNGIFKFRRLGRLETLNILGLISFFQVVQLIDFTIEKNNGKKRDHFTAKRRYKLQGLFGGKWFAAELYD